VNLLVALGTAVLMALGVLILDFGGCLLQSDLLIAKAARIGEYHMIWSLLLAISLFLFFSNLQFQSRWINTVAASTMGIYLLHDNRLLKQVIELPDGTRYFSIAQMVRRPVAPHPLAQPRFAIGLGCEIRHAARLIYAAGMDLDKAEGTPIGVNCRLCERENCSQRAEPPITRTLLLDENTRRVSSFVFSNAREL
jgi:hypothetical protein